MEVAFAVIGGAGLEPTNLAEGVQALAMRADLDEVLAVADDDGPAPEFDVRLSAPFARGGAAWCEVEVTAHDGFRLLLDAARTIAGHLDRNVRVLASLREPLVGTAVEIAYRAVDVAPDGSSHDVAVAAPPVVGSLPAVEAPERLAAILDALVADASGGAKGPRTRGAAAARAFRRTPLFESVRLNRLARRILAATAVVFAPEDTAGNVRVRIDASDGARQISIVTLEEAEALRRATGH